MEEGGLGMIQAGVSPGLRPELSSSQLTHPASGSISLLRKMELRVLTSQYAE
jgi:hypothetical protein